VLLTGDTLFPGGPGNTKSDLGDFETIIESIERRIYAKFTPETIVMPGHGADTTIAAELPALDEWVRRGW
jgi:glyoxylase-like metal-dependent hydrolase (beta-lactamase superfamily II)